VSDYDTNPTERLGPADRFSLPLPATGAWQPGDPVGERKFVTINDGQPLLLDSGESLPEVVVAYESWGDLDESGTNAILVCHALTGDSHAAGPAGPGHPEKGWWDDLIGPGRALDTDRYFVVCANTLGGCQGTTGPSSIDPRTDRHYGSTFPIVTMRDMVVMQAGLADALGVRSWLTVIGGSMGGMYALEWPLMYPERVRSVIPLATNAAASSLQIAWSAVGRLALANDPNFHDGDYYEAEDGKGPWMGLAVARQIAQVTYRTGAVFQRRFGRDLYDPENEFDRWGRFQMESYLDHHGQKLVRRFDANSYLVLNRAMDLHDVGRDRGGVDAALAGLRVPVLTASITSDALYPPHEQEHLEETINAGGGDCRRVIINSPEGHDGFLLEHEKLGAHITEFLDEIVARGSGSERPA
jgi:homoserine O-acetyltransferase